MSTFVFFHVGNDLTMPTAMVASIAAHNPGAEIIQVTDQQTPTVPGVTWSHVTQGDPAHLMLWRTRAFAMLQLQQPALYIDTDMIVRKPILPAMLLQEAVIAVCRRSFQKDAVFNVAQRGHQYTEHANKTLDQVYPYIGCATITANADPWVELAMRYEALPERYKAWYGDQEVLREYVNSMPSFCVAHLPEHVYACLPEYLDAHPNPAIMHYKGTRKKLMFSAQTLA